MTVIKVPATSANLGPGFDSLGIALSMYLTLTVGSKCDEWVVEHDLGADIPTDEENMIIKTALGLAPNLEPHKVRVESKIPLARGLGSSSTAIVAGLALANHLGKLGIGKDELVQKATELEGHPDNVAPAILGDFVAATYVNGHVTSVKGNFPKLSFLAYIPDYELATSQSREALPEQLAFKDAVIAGSIGNALVASILTGNLTEIGPLMEADRYHEQARLKLVPHLEVLRKLGHEVGALATYLSGAGPTVMVVIDQSKVADFIKEAQALGLTGRFEQLEVERQGLVVSE